MLVSPPTAMHVQKNIRYSKRQVAASGGGHFLELRAVSVGQRRQARASVEGRARAPSVFQSLAVGTNFPTEVTTVNNQAFATPISLLTFFFPKFPGIREGAKCSAPANMVYEPVCNSGPLECLELFFFFSPQPLHIFFILLCDNRLPTHVVVVMVLGMPW